MSDYATKINALLAKAAATTHDAERESLTEAAERLMVKWGIDDAMLDDATRRDKARKATPIVEHRYRVFGVGAALLAELVAAPAAGGIAPVRTLIRRGSPFWWCIGYEDDLARIELYIPSLLEQAAAAWKRQLRTWGPGFFWDSTDRNRARISFFEGFGWRVHHRLADMFREDLATTTGAELVLANRKDRVDEKVNQRYPNLKTVAERKSHDSEAAYAGHLAGDAASISAGAVTR